MLHDHFIEKTKFETSEFKALMNILAPLNVHAEEGRKLLCLVNQIIDFYIYREVESENDTKMPIIYFPLCEDWSQLLCEEFVTLKMSLLWGSETRTGLLNNYRSRPFVVLPEGADKREQNALRKQFRFKRDVAKFMNEQTLGGPSIEKEKCLLYSRNISDEYRLTSNTLGHYHFSHDVVGRSLTDEKSLILLGENENDVYDAIEENDGEIKVPNMFLFLQKDMDGRNTKFCMQMQRSTINEYNEDYDAGIRNVLFFAFSQKPYRLQRVYENKQNLVERLQREKITEAHDFISFTKEEMDFLFGRKEANSSVYELGYDEGSEDQQIKKAFDFILQDLSPQINIKLRNELAVCYTEKSGLKIKEEILKQNPDANEEYINYLIQLTQAKYQKRLCGVLFEWINFCQIAVVLDYKVEPYYKEQLKAFLKLECGATSVKFYTFKSIKAHKKGALFLNSIQENKILVLSMLNHRTGHNFAIYPNSFDQYYINPGQSLLQINNKITFDPHFSWYQYRYVEQMKMLLNSDFRIKCLNSAISLPNKPIDVGPEPEEDEDEQYILGNQAGREQNRVTVTFGLRQHRTFDEDELVLCKYMNNVSIRSISDILRDFDDPTVLEIQPLVDFYQPLEIFIDNEEHKYGNGESLIRNNPKYGLTDEEKVSKREMWKILLEHLTKAKGEQVVYDEIIQPFLPIIPISFNQFRNWLKKSNTYILPLSRLLQERVLIGYLNIDPLYLRLLRHKKSIKGTKTEDKNSIFRTFLTHCLLETNTQKAYNGLRHEVCDYLNIASGDDIRIIIDLIKDETLNFRPIKSIKYD